MAKELKIQEIIKQTGCEPIEHLTIIVRYTPANLSDRIAHFFGSQYYVLQVCRTALVLLPLHTVTAAPQKEPALTLPLANIQSVSITEDFLDYRIELQTKEGAIALSAQQKELSMLRSSGFFAAEDVAGIKNWHCRNLECTLTYLKELKEMEPVSGEPS